MKILCKHDGHDLRILMYVCLLCMCTLLYRRALLAFSTEAMEASASEQTSPSHSDKNSCADTGFHLALTGRYRHAESYLRHVLTSTGWEVLSIQRTVIRMNAGVPVQGYLVIARRGDTCNEDV